MSITLLDQDGDAIEARIDTPAGLLTVICRVELRGERVVLYDFHIDGPGAGSLGIPLLRAAILDVMESYDVASVEVHGFTRTTGANPGRVPRPLVFRR